MSTYFVLFALFFLKSKINVIGSNVSFFQSLEALMAVFEFF